MRLLGSILCALWLTGCVTWTEAARARQDGTARTLEALRQRPDDLKAFVAAMPKGADLHNHLSGSVSTESLIRWATEDGLCLDPTTFIAAEPPCATNAVPLAQVTPGSELYRNLIAAWSMQDVAGDVLARHQHFFDAFHKFDLVTRSDKRIPDMMVEATRAAAKDHVGYLELMLSFGGSRAGKVAAKLMQPSDTWEEPYLLAKRSALVAEPEFVAAVESARGNLEGWMTTARKTLGCDGPRPEPACRVELRFLVQASRTLPREQVFGQFVFAHELAQVEPRVVGLNMVQPEEHSNSLQFYDDEMKALDVLHRAYAADPSRKPVHISLHAGELIRDVLPSTPEGQRHLTFHIRHAVELGHAERIGHGADVLGETEGAGAEALLAELRERNVLVEICLTSNAGLLGLEGRTHPLPSYLRHGVPVALATDDPGILRTDMNGELLRAVVAEGADYAVLKGMARASLEHSFLSGPSLWRSTAPYAPVEACGGEEPGNAAPSATCRRFLDGSPRAAAQWRLESDLTAFEAARASL